MKKGIQLVFVLMLTTFLSCNKQSGACCSGKSCKSNNKSMTKESGACSKCGKTSCDASCESSKTDFSTEEGERLKSLIPSCNLSTTQLIDRKKELDNPNSIFNKIAEVKEEKEGYTLVFKDDGTTSQQILDFINFERKCCTNFSFAMEFNPDKTILFKMYGSEAIKEELQKGFTELGVIK